MGFSGLLLVWRWVARRKWGEELASFQFPVFREEREGAPVDDEFVAHVSRFQR